MPTEDELYKELGALTKARDKWEENLPYVSSLLNHEAEKIQAKALWLLGEMGFANPQAVQNAVPAIASFMNNPAPLLRERAVNAIGRIGRGDYHLIEPYWRDLFRFASDENARVRLSFIWASENIATNTPDIYEDEMPVFAKLLYDADDKVRMEAPEFFRVLGKRRPEFVIPFIEELQRISETDDNRVVKIHCQGAIKAASFSRIVREQNLQKDIDSHTMAGITVMASSEIPSMEGTANAEDRRLFKAFQSKHQNASPLR